MSERRVLDVPAAARGARLDRWLADSVPGRSRTALEKLVAQGLVTVDGRAAPRSLKLRGGERVEVELPPPEPATLVGEDIPLAVLYEDDDVLVLDKPAGLVIHPGAGVRSGTLVHTLVHHLGTALGSVGAAGRPGIVHRLDKGTTGIMVVAKTADAHARLSAQFARRTVLKEYLAVVLGAPGERGTVDAPIGRSRAVRTRMAVTSRGGRSALTTWRRLETFGPHAALLSVRLATGRTHQVRVHLASAGHPLAGDATYGGRRVESVRDPAVRSALRAFARPALHSCRLAFDHPRTGLRIELEAPLPPDLAGLVEALRDATRRHAAEL